MGVSARRSPASNVTGEKNMVMRIFEEARRGGCNRNISVGLGEATREEGEKKKGKGKKEKEKKGKKKKKRKKKKNERSRKGVRDKFVDKVSTAQI